MTPAPSRSLSVYYFGSGLHRVDATAGERGCRRHEAFPPTGSMTLYSLISVRVGSG
jgi:hypothetical protein